MKIIFLDIDGVLNSMSYHVSEKYSSNTNDIIDDKAMIVLKTIVENTGAKIVLSSSWRDYKTDSVLANYLVNKFSKYGLSIYDSTCHVDGYRPYEINLWLETHTNIDEYLIIDDDFFVDEYAEYNLDMHLIQTYYISENKEEGLLASHIDPAIRILNMNN